MQSMLHDPICRINTSGKGELCGLFAIANCIGIRDKATRQKAYDKLELTEEADKMYGRYMDDFNKRFEFINKLEVNVDDIIKYKRAVLGDAFNEQDVKVAFRNGPQQMIDDYKDFLFCERREDAKDYTGNDFQTTQPCPFNLTEFAELIELKEQSTSNNISFLTALDESVKFTEIGERTEYYDGYSRQILTYQPNCYQKFIGFAIKEKRKEWKPQEESKIKKSENYLALQSLLASPQETLKRALFNDLFGLDDENFLSKETLRFLVNDKILPDYQLKDVEFNDHEQVGNCSQIHLASGHFTAHARKSEIENANREHKKTKSSKTKTGEDSGFSSSLPDDLALKKTIEKNPHTVARAKAIQARKMEIEQSENLIYGITTGVLGVGATLFCASALGFGVVSSPVMLTAIGVGVGCVAVGVVVVQPLAQKLFANETKALTPE